MISRCNIYSLSITPYVGWVLSICPLCQKKEFVWTDAFCLYIYVFMSKRKACVNRCFLSLYICPFCLYVKKKSLYEQIPSVFIYMSFLSLCRKEKSEWTDAFCLYIYVLYVKKKSLFEQVLYVFMSKKGIIFTLTYVKRHPDCDFCTTARNTRFFAQKGNADSQRVTEMLICQYSREGLLTLRLGRTCITVRP